MQCSYYYIAIVHTCVIWAGGSEIKENGGSFIFCECSLQFSRFKLVTSRSLQFSFP